MLGKAGMSCEKWLSVRLGEDTFGKDEVSQGIGEILSFGKEGIGYTRARFGNRCLSTAELETVMFGEATLGKYDARQRRWYSLDRTFGILERSVEEEIWLRGTFGKGTFGNGTFGKGGSLDKRNVW